MKSIAVAERQAHNIMQQSIRCKTRDGISSATGALRIVISSWHFFCIELQGEKQLAHYERPLQLQGDSLHDFLESAFRL